MGSKNTIPGKSIFGTNKFIEYRVGNIPVIITAPHGGKDIPENIPER
jgi:N-formylglutamate amidohydrolase